MTVYFVGAGPGAADLLTIRAAQLLSTAQICLYPGTYLDPKILQHCSPEAKLVDTQHLNLDEIISLIVAAHTEGNTVVRLCSGDTSLYSAVHEQTSRLTAAGIPWQLTPGVPAYAATAALAGVELTVPHIAQSVVLTRTQLRSTAMPAGEELAKFAATGSTLVLHLSITKITQLATELSHYYGDDCPVVVGYRVSQPEQQLLRGTLKSIAAQVNNAQFTQAAVILVGPALATTGTYESYLYDANRERRIKKLG